ncbi:MAG: flagellar export chaperone FliS [Deltaproteobacteria bacterium]|nr:flagellar export chaperone FliS [Deltaproteobacteria bacterium]
MITYGQNQYRKTQVATVDRGRLIVLLYEGAISFLNKAKAAVDEKDIPTASGLINRALDIIDELNASLNMDQGGDIAANLRRLYLFMVDQLVKAKIKGEKEPIDEVIRMLTTLNDAWRQAVATPEAQEVLRRQAPVQAAQVRGSVTI